MISDRPIAADDIAFFLATSIIFGLELSAVGLAVFLARIKLGGKEAAIYIGNNASLSALVNGESSPSAAYCLIATLW